MNKSFQDGVCVYVCVCVCVCVCVLMLGASPFPSALTLSPPVCSSAVTEKTRTDSNSFLPGSCYVVVS